MSRAQRKCVFGACVDSKGPDQTAQSDQGRRCPLPESLDTTNVSMESRGPDETLRMLKIILNPHILRMREITF